MDLDKKHLEKEIERRKEVLESKESLETRYYEQLKTDIADLERELKN